MNYSLRLKLFTALSCLILFFVLLSWVLNNFMLEKYYFDKKVNNLKENYKLINELYKGDFDEMLIELEKMERMKGLHIVILNKEYEIVYNSRQKRDEPRTVMPRRRLFPNDIRDLPESIAREKSQQVLKGQILIETRVDDRLNSHFINLFSRLYNEDLIFLSTSVAAIEESAEVANNFFLFTGIVTIITGSILIFLITGRFTKPILKLNSIAQKMTALDFSTRYPVKTNDEIGQLGRSINSLSDQLEKSILELRSANESLKEDIEKKQKIDEMRKEFISSVSHELKTPIALIQGYAEGLKVNVIEDEENKNFYCDVIVDEALKMNKLVKQLLELAQIESGELHLDRVKFNILHLICQIIKKYDLSFKDKAINIVVEKDEEITVNADYDRIEQILMNYLTNAINHVDENKMIRLCIKKNASKALISVFNSGKHIQKDCLEKIWMSFYKIDKARTREYGGTGLGLSIVKAIQEAHNNKYGVNNVEGGVEFWFELDLDNIKYTEI